MLRTHTCGELRLSDVNKKVVLAGWIDRIRDLGGVKFVMLRDRYGQTQIVLSKDFDLDLKREAVVRVEGVVRERPKDTVNRELPTGEIEVLAERVEVLSSPQRELPFYPGEPNLPSEDVRLKYRYIDLRRKEMTDRIITRHRVAQAVRQYLSSLGFIEVETPFLTKSTPEGARDFLVPSRLKPGTFYALPQSPQLFKQLLMVGGLDRYFQIVRCFRDEDLRADRQPEFTQIDIEMSFVTREDVLETVEGMVRYVFKQVLDIDLAEKFDRLSYQYCLDTYGSDKPDRRIGMEFVNLTEHFKNSDYNVVKNIVENGGVVKGFVVKNFASKMSRKVAEEYETIVKKNGLGGILWFALENEMKGSALKHLKNIYEEISRATRMNQGDVCLMVAGKPTDVNAALGELRKTIGDMHFAHLKVGFDVFWVLDFPMFEYSEEEGRYVAQHHPFTMPNLEDLDRYKDEDLSKIRAQSYDLVINGYEVGSGSIRIHNRDLQREVFRLMQLSEEEIRIKFGFLLEAFQYGAPPHGGIALGLDRLVAIICNVSSIREVIAFPKTASGVCPLTGAPDVVSEQQLRELKIKITGGNEV
ncbi:aspartyl-tRNA synthase [Pseudothermotoga hypogea DSM 11164 = NBRC 106472]|uniref:Aspartate--tRNA ligase n=1 Tax=Pseudothermotoga hypogea DSM 11164 = NBRC 106472 TaxID=1123384 RepID=A0A0X1KRN7_9THEM|nr:MULTISPECIES: aspartate--tRNA ligase [Pseudothermotoga]AJC73913.1 aspartyl-tRNA synthase [Pseudothermotoga hypogea DSM 11164 = NBRC 106472]MDI6862153.1 aspartate--tRNA ligase [Pseudothermotoga sp.]